MALLEQEQPLPRRRRHRRRKRRGRSFFAVFMSLLIIGGVGAGLYFGGRTLLGGMSNTLFGSGKDFPGPGSGSVDVTVPQGASLRVIGQELEKNNVVASVDAFVAAADKNPDATGIQPGTYTLKREMKAEDAVAGLLDAKNIQSRLTIPEGYRLGQTVQRIEEKTSFSKDEIKKAISNAQLPSYSSDKPEGFLFPATYDIQNDTTAQALVSSMIARFNQAAETVQLVQRAQNLDMDPLEIVTVASIIEKEAQQEGDLERVSEVIHNRLSGKCEAVGITQGKLEMDSTVHYAANDYSSIFTTEEMRQTQSPYNTYLHAGLPPGPIASPGEAALEAALTPSDEGNCYFVTTDLDSGETKFSKTADQHESYVQELQAYCRESEKC